MYAIVGLIAIVIALFFYAGYQLGKSKKES
jgi:hypothetical protein